MFDPDVVHRFFHPVLPARELGRGPVRVELAGRAYALFRDASGRPAALEDRCPHRWAPLSKGRVRPDGRLACGYHGWHFDAAGCGINPSQPSLKKCDVPAYRVVERHGYLWLAGQQVPDEAFPPMDFQDEGYEFIAGAATRFQAPLHVSFDNFSEDEHTPYVHTFLGWIEESLPKMEFEAENHDDRSEVHYAAPQRPSFWTPFLLIRRGDFFDNRWVTRFDPLRTAYDLHWFDPATRKPRPVESRFVIYFVPETEKTTWLHAFGYVRLKDRRLRPLLPVVRRVVMRLGRNEVADDARWIPNVADTPFEMRGMRLDKYDKPLTHNHKLMQRLYWAVPDAPSARDRAALAGSRSAPAPPAPGVNGSAPDPAPAPSSSSSTSQAAAPLQPALEVTVESDRRPTA